MGIIRFAPIYRTGVVAPVWLSVHSRRSDWQEERGWTHSHGRFDHLEEYRMRPSCLLTPLSFSQVLYSRVPNYGNGLCLRLGSKFRLSLEIGSRALSGALSCVFGFLGTRESGLLVISDNGDSRLKADKGIECRGLCSLLYISNNLYIYTVL